MTKLTAIKKFCSECSGGAFKDKVLCTDPKCLLWPFRLGVEMKSKKYWAIMDDIKDRYPKDVSDLGTYGLSPDVFFGSNSTDSAIKRARTKDKVSDDHIDQAGAVGRL